VTEDPIYISGIVLSVNVMRARVAITIKPHDSQNITLRADGSEVIESIASYVALALCAMTTGRKLELSYVMQDDEMKIRSVGMVGELLPL
jgi:hypothetical protein